MNVADIIRRAATWLPFTALTLLAGAAGFGLVREAVRTRPLPPMPIIAEAPPAAPLLVVARHSLGGPIETAHFAVIAVRNLFSASRSEQVVAAPASGSRPFLHGVVLDGSNSRAYLEEPDAQRVLGYALGDAVAGGKLVRILDDRVVIRRPDGLQEIMLRDPAKPRPPARAGSEPVPLRRPPPLPRASAAGAATPAAPVPNAPAPSAEVSGQTTPPQGAR